MADLDVRGPYDLGEVALMGFGHREERTFDGVMRLAFCVDGDFERQVGAEVRQLGQRLEVRVHRLPGSRPLDEVEAATVLGQVARVISADHDGEAFAAVCSGDPVLRRLQAVAPGFRPSSFYSPYEAAVWSILSARRARSQGIALRTRLSQQCGATFDLAGIPTVALPTPSALLGLDTLPGLPQDRIPRLHAVAEAARAGDLSAEALLALEPEEALRRLQQLPGIGPFYSSLVLVRACGAADILPTDESRLRDLTRDLYGFDHQPSGAELAALTDGWRPFRTWAAVLIRAVSSRLPAS